MRTTLVGSTVTSASRSIGVDGNPNLARSVDTSQSSVQNPRCPSVVDRISKIWAGLASTSAARVMDPLIRTSYGIDQLAVISVLSKIRRRRQAHWNAWCGMVTLRQGAEGRGRWNHCK